MAICVSGSCYCIESSMVASVYVCVREHFLKLTKAPTPLTAEPNSPHPSHPSQ